MSRVPLQGKVLNENARIAEELRERFRRHQVFVLNIISSPGSGKTTLLENTLEYLPEDARVAVLTGDIQTENDANRLKRYGLPVRQVITGGTCHLDARMVEKHIADWDLKNLDLLIIENVGNLVCPASYDLGEAVKVVLLSVAEGEDKPLKYPAIFHKASLMVLTKTDLLPYVPFDVPTAVTNARRVHPEMEVLKVSCLTGNGMRDWLKWLERQQQDYLAEMTATVR